MNPRPGTVLLALCLTAGCKPRTDPPLCHSYLAPGGELSPSDLDRLEHSPGDPCPSLGAPALDVDARGVVLDGQVIVLPHDLPTGQGGRVDDLFEDMKSDRYLWKRLHPGRTFGATLDVTLARDADAVPTASILYSASLAGYSRMRIHAGGEELSLFCAQPVLGGTDYYPLMLRVITREDGRLDVRYERLRAPGMPRDLEMPTPAPPPGPLPDGKSVAAYLEDACRAFPKGCVDVVALRLTTGKFAPVLRLTRDVLAAPPLSAERSPPIVVFEVPGLYLEQPNFVE